MNDEELTRQLELLLDITAQQVQQIIDPVDPDMARVPLGYLSLIYTYDLKRVGERLLAPIITANNVDHLEDLITAAARAHTMLASLALDGNYDLAEAEHISTALVANMADANASASLADIWQHNRVGQVLAILDPKHRAEQRLRANVNDADLYEDYLNILRGDMQNFVLGYAYFVQSGAHA